MELQTFEQHQLNDIDYMWRPEILNNVPWYFFAAMTHAETEQKFGFPWYAIQNKNGQWETHPHGAVMHSKHFKQVALSSAEASDASDQSKPYVTAPCYCKVLTKTAWLVPNILGRFPRTPSPTSASEERGHFAVFMLLLFKPWRSLKRDLLSATQSCLDLSSALDAVYAHYAAWYA